MADAFVNKLSGYAALGSAERDALAAACQSSRVYRSGHDLIREGDKPGPSFVMLEGWGCRYKILPEGTRQIMAFMMPGDWCDIHVGVLREMDHSISTLTKARVATIPRETMESLINLSPLVTRAFWWAQLVDEGVLRSWIVSMGRRDSLERVAHLMCELYVRMYNVGHATSDSCEMPLTQIVLADALGLTPVHVNRVLKKLREEQIMGLRGGRLIISDPRRLATIAGFDETYLHRRLRIAA